MSPSRTLPARRRGAPSHGIVPSFSSWGAVPDSIGISKYATWVPGAGGSNLAPDAVSFRKRRRAARNARSASAHWRVSVHRAPCPTARSSRRSSPRLLVEDVLQLGDERLIEREYFGDQPLELLGGRRLEGELGLVHLGDEGRVLQRFLERLAQNLYAVLRRARRQREGPGEGAGILDAGSDQPPGFFGLREAEGERDTREIGERTVARLQYGDDFTGVERAAPGRAHRLPRPASSRELAGRDRQPDLGRALVARDELGGKSERRLQYPSVVVRGSAGSDTAQLHGRLRR